MKLLLLKNSPLELLIEVPLLEFLELQKLQERDIMKIEDQQQI
jgi:hypothetical protein